MSKAEKRALEAYPVIMHTLIPVNDDIPEREQDCNEFHRKAYIEGYKQAEKDIIENACNWLERNYDSSIYQPNDSGYYKGKKEFIDDLKQAMKDE